MLTSELRLPEGMTSSKRPSALVMVPPAAPMVFVTALPVGVPTEVTAAVLLPAGFVVELFPEVLDF